jgi:hypothetical protein
MHYLMLMHYLHYQRYMADKSVMERRSPPQADGLDAEPTETLWARVRAWGQGNRLDTAVRYGTGRN